MQIALAPWSRRLGFLSVLFLLLNFLLFCTILQVFSCPNKKLELENLKISCKQWQLWMLILVVQQWIIDWLQMNWRTKHNLYFFIALRSSWLFLVSQRIKRKRIKANQWFINQSYQKVITIRHQVFNQKWASAYSWYHNTLKGKEVRQINGLSTKVTKKWSK